MQYKLSELISKFGGVLKGNDVSVSAIMPTDKALPGEITFFSDKKFAKELPMCKASAIILKAEDADKVDLPAIVCDDPYLYFAKVSSLFNPTPQLARGLSTHSFVDATANIGSNCAIAQNVIIGIKSVVGNNTQIYPNSVIGDNVLIGDNVTIYPNVTIYANVKIGNNTTIHSGVVIGSDGFGYAPDSKKQRHKIPQVGGVCIGNNVEIGANSTVDGGTFGPTIIEDGVVIDNLVQIAHNVKVGEHSVIAAQVGIAGSSVIGKYCILAGSAGIADHISICDHAVIGAYTGIGKNITKPDLYMGAYPFSNYKDYAKNAVLIRHLTELKQKLIALEKRQAIRSASINPAYIWQWFKLAIKKLYK